MSASFDDQNQPLSFLVAKNASDLRKLMIAMNRRHNKRFHYLNPVPFKGKWYVWFEIKESDIAKKELSNAEES